MARLALGLDSSTQSLSAIIVDIDAAQKVFEHSQDYRKDSRLNGFGIGADYILPPRVEGEANQPVEMILASVDAMFEDLRASGIAVKDIVVINNSAQQHGHVYLNNRAENRFARLRESGGGERSLIELLGGSFSYPTAPIWMTSNTATQADCIRECVGGKDKLIRLSGSNAPLRFTGLIVRRVAQQFPDAYRATATIQLISSLISAMLTGYSRAPMDYANACGTSLMDYRWWRWSQELLKATSEGLPGGTVALSKKLPELVPPRHGDWKNRVVFCGEVRISSQMPSYRRVRGQSASQNAGGGRPAQLGNQLRQHGGDGWRRPRSEWDGKRHV